MREIASVMLLNFKQGVREKVFYGACVFFLFFLGVCVLFGALSPGEDQAVLRSAGLAGLELSSLILLIFSLVSGFYREKENRILEVYLTNCGRTRYLAGKLAGYFLIAFFYILAAGCGFLLLLGLYRAFSPAVAVAFYTLFLKTAIVITAGLALCCFFSSPVLALISTLFFYLSSELAYSALKALMLNGAHPVQLAASRAVYYLLPNMARLDIKSLAAHGQVPEPQFFLTATGYSIAYIVFLWMICRYIFVRKEY